MKNPIKSLGLLAIALTAACGAPQSGTEVTPPAAGEAEKPVLHIYSARHYDSDQILYAAFENEAGVEVEVREAKADQLLETMKAEGDVSPADLIIASDAGALWRFQSAGLTQAVESNELNDLVAPEFREADGHWFGVARRLRLVAYDPTQISPDQVDEWTDLADPALEGEICVRASSNIYNLSLMAELIDRVGADQAQNWAEGVVSNMARAPQGGDTDQVKAVAAGECSVAIVNHYYWARLSQSAAEADRAVANATTLIVPDFPDGGGAHVNITGAAVSRTAEDPGLAARFIAFMLTAEGQDLLTRETQEFPLSDTTPPPPGAELVPAFAPGATPLETFGRNQAEAQRLYDLAGWN